jgi:glutamine amidotransferase-like uncharacterized protein
MRKFEAQRLWRLVKQKKRRACLDLAIDGRIYGGFTGGLAIIDSSKARDLKSMSRENDKRRPSKLISALDLYRPVEDGTVNLSNFDWELEPGTTSSRSEESETRRYRQVVREAD